jgi:hypothetical protein
VGIVIFISRIITQNVPFVGLTGKDCNHMGGFFAAGFTWICSLFTANSVNPPLCGKVKKSSRLKGLRGLKPITEFCIPLFCYGVSAAMPLISPNVTRDTKLRLNHMVEFILFYFKMVFCKQHLII